MAAPHVAGVAALWWQAVRQSDLPANATLVRGKLLSSARRDGFSAAVYPGDRGAGRALAPEDGASVGTHRVPQKADRERLKATIFAGDGYRKAGGAALEPIYLDSATFSTWPGGGRLC
jgi:hypothetical protein